MAIPLRSDRSAWDTVGYANLHARDLENGAPLVHLPGVANNQVAIWDGSKWVGVPLEASELLDVDMTQVQDGHVLIYDAVSGKWLTGPMTADAETEIHAASHQAGGGDEINVQGLSGVLADEQHAGFIKDTPIEFVPESWGGEEAVLVYNPATDRFEDRPKSHAANHQNGGADEIDVTGLPGLLQDWQKAGHINEKPVNALNPEDGETLIYRSSGGGSWGPEPLVIPPHTHPHSQITIDDPEADYHPQYPRADQNDWISGRWTFSPLSPGAPPFDITSLGTGRVGYLNADMLDGLHVNQIAPYYAKDVTLYVSTTGNDNNAGTSSGAPLRKIQTAIDRFAGYSLSGCKIVVASGSYSENVNVGGINAGMMDGLTIEGDTCELAGMMFIHGDNYVANGASYAGSGTMTLSSDNNGTGGRIRVFCARATTNPAFTSAGVTSANYCVVFNGATYTEYPIYGVGSYYLVLDSTATAPAINVAGRGFAIAPKVRIYGATAADTYAMEVFQTGVRLKGLYLNGYYGGLRAYIGAIMSERCVYLQRANVQYYGSVHLTSLSFYFGRFDSFNDAHNSVFGTWAGMAVSYSAHANVGKGFTCGTGSYSLYCSAGTCYANGARVTGDNVGVFATARGYINAAATSAANWCPTKYSPATSDALGNSNASITYS